MSSLLTLIIIANSILATSPQLLRYNKELSKNVTFLLDTLLQEDKYDKRFRPNFGGDPVRIEVNMYIKSLGPVSELDEDYSMDCYFRQMWFDDRLKFNKNESGLKELSMNWLFLERVWKPDTYFVNGKKSYLHSITVPNKFLRLRRDGFLTYSMRLTIIASCPMHLRKFPLDSQACPLEIGSYGYSNTDLIYAWSKSGKDPVGREEGVNLAQYDLTGIETIEEIRLSSRRDNFSVAGVHFHLKRHTGYFMLQVYVPCTLIVSCSWVSFWIDPNAVPARVTLGVTTVLSITTLGFGGRSQMPKTSYATALDWFVILCFAFVFASMVEFAAINFMDKMKKDLGSKAKSKQAKGQILAGVIMGTVMEILNTMFAHDSRIMIKQATMLQEYTSIDTDQEPVAILRELWNRFKIWLHQQMKNPWSLHKPPGSKFSKVDIYSRTIFPLSFAVINTIYWTSFMYYVKDERPSTESTAFQIV